MLAAGRLFYALAFDAAGYHEEARRFYEFALSLQQPDGGWHMPLVPVEGRGGTEYIADDLAGPGGEKPIRFGNAAMHQIQLDNAGNILDGCGTTTWPPATGSISAAAGMPSGGGYLAGKVLGATGKRYLENPRAQGPLALRQDSLLRRPDGRLPFIDRDRAAAVGGTLAPVAARCGASCCAGAGP